MPIRVQVEVTGPAELLQRFRTSANALLDEQFDDRYAEHHTHDKLEYRLVGRQGIPFPPFVAASEECPELLVSVIWQGRDGPRSGSATISAGKVLGYAQDEAAGTGDGAQVCIDAAADGAISLAVALRARSRSDWIGYVVNAHRQAYFACAIDASRIEIRLTEDVASAWARRCVVERAAVPGVAAVSASAEPIEADILQALDELSRGFADDWIWFDAEPELDIALERHRFTQYGLRVYPANLRSEKIRRTVTRRDDHYHYSTLDEGGGRVVEALRRCWPDGAA